MHWGFEYGMGFGWIFIILFWVIIILGIIYFIKILASGSPPGKEPHESAEEVLRKRYARGEMSKEEFEEAMAVLKKHS